MSNLTSAHPWVLDTAGTIVSTPIKIIEARWRGIDSDADDLIIKDIAANVLATKKGSDANGDSILIWHQPKVCAGFVLNTIDSGYLEVFPA